MSEELVRVEQGVELAPWEELEEAVRETWRYVENAKSEATRRAYASDWKGFEAWTAVHGLQPLPASAETVSTYASHLAKSCKVSTIVRKLTAIAQAHRASRLESPTRSALVQSTLQGIRRIHGTATTEKAPATLEILKKMLNELPTGLAAQRDRALLLIGFAGAFRRSELAALDREDLSITEAGVEVTLRRSKTDPEGAGVKIGIPYGEHGETCPVRALRTWLEAGAISRGAVFRGINRHGKQQGRLSGHSVGAIVKKYAHAAGYDAFHFGGHSLRAGFITTAAEAGVEERIIQKQSRHKGVMMLRRYIRGGQLFKENAAAKVGL